MNLLLSTPGRCGTHWLSWILCEIFNLEHQKTHRAANTPIAGGDRLYLSHDPPWLFRDSELDIIIAMVRDPRDIVVSAAYYWASDLHGGQYDVLRDFWDLDLPDDATFDEALHRLKTTGFNVRWFRSYIDHRNICQAVVRYEDLWRWPHRPLAETIVALGQTVPASRVSQALERYSFRRRSGGRDRGQQDTTSFYRKGVIGDWKNHFTPEENEAFCKRFAWLLEPLGYS